MAVMMTFASMPFSLASASIVCCNALFITVSSRRPEQRVHLTACVERPGAFDHCIPVGGVAPRSNTAGVLPRRALPTRRITGLGAPLDFTTGRYNSTSSRARATAVSGTRRVVLPSSITIVRSSTAVIRPDTNRCPSTGFGRHDLDPPSNEPHEVGQVTQRPVESGRRHLQRVSVVEGDLRVENRAHVHADLRAVGHRHVFALATGVRWSRRRWTVDDDPQDPADRFATELQVEEIEPVAAHNPLGDRPHVAKTVSSRPGHSVVPSAVPVAFGRRCIPPGCVTPPSNTARYSRSSRLANRAPHRPRFVTVTANGTTVAPSAVPVAFGRRCIPPGCVTPPSNTARYSRSSRLANRAPHRPRCVTVTANGTTQVPPQKQKAGQNAHSLSITGNVTTPL